MGILLHILNHSNWGNVKIVGAHSSKTFSIGKPSPRLQTFQTVSWTRPRFLLPSAFIEGFVCLWMDGGCLKPDSVLPFDTSWCCGLPGLLQLPNEFPPSPNSVTSFDWWVDGAGAASLLTPRFLPPLEAHQMDGWMVGWWKEGEGREGWRDSLVGLLGGDQSWSLRQSALQASRSGPTFYPRSHWLEEA